MNSVHEARSCVELAARGGAPDPHRRQAFGSWLREQRTLRGLCRKQVAPLVESSARQWRLWESAMQTCHVEAETLLRALDKAKLQTVVLATPEQIQEVLAVIGCSMASLSLHLGQHRHYIVKILRGEHSSTLSLDDLLRCLHEPPVNSNG